LLLLGRLSRQNAHRNGIFTPLPRLKAPHVAVFGQQSGGISKTMASCMRATISRGLAAMWIALVTRMTARGFPSPRPAALSLPRGGAGASTSTGPPGEKKGAHHRPQRWPSTRARQICPTQGGPIASPGRAQM